MAAISHCALLCRPSATLACAANSRAACLGCVWCGPVGVPAWHTLPMPGDALLTPQPAAQKGKEKPEKGKEKPEPSPADVLQR